MIKKELIAVLIVIALGISLVLLNGCVPKTCSQNTDCPENYKCENSICVPVGCVGEGNFTPGTISPEELKHMAKECCSGLKRLLWNESISGCENPPVGGGFLCTAKCGNGVCDPKEEKCTCPEDCEAIAACAKESELFSVVYKYFPEHCCENLTEWMSGFDTSISIADECYETGLVAGSPIGTCINCKNGICEEIENPCNCLQDCTGKNKSTYKTVQEFCDEGYSKYCFNEEMIEELNLSLCKLC